MFLAGCAISPLEPAQPFTEVTPPAEWEADYQWVWEHCGRAIRRSPVWRYSQLRFYVVNADTFTWDGAGHVYGAWQGDRIYLAQWAVTDQFVRQHELLHAQLGMGDHPPIFQVCAERSIP